MNSPEAFELKPEILRFEIRNNLPLDLSDFALAMMSFSNEFQKHNGANFPEIPSDKPRLFVKEIRSGSVIADLVAAAASSLPLVIEHGESILKFGKWFKSAVDFYAGKSNDRPSGIDNRSLKNMCDIIAPVAKDRSSQLNIGVINVNATNPIFHVTYNSDEASAARGRMLTELGEGAKIQRNRHERVLMYWHQARNITDSPVGDRVVIESVSKSALKVVFANESLKFRTISMANENPFKLGFIVDVEVQTVRDVPKAYTVTDVYDSISLFDEGDDNDSQLTLPHTPANK